MINRLIHITYKVLLPLPVCKWENQIFYGVLSFLLPFKFIICPFTILFYYILEPTAQLYKTILFMKIFDFFCFDIAIRFNSKIKKGTEVPFKLTLF